MIETNYDETIDTVEPKPLKAANRTWLIWIAAVIVLLDQFSKYIIESTLPLYQSWAPFPSIADFFRISHTSNTGIAFGMFPAGSTIFAWAAVLISAAIFVYNYTLPDGPFSLRLALGLQMGGALGNWIDRQRIGHVTDFLDFGPWPVFNVADTAVVAGAILLAWLLWREERQISAANAARKAAEEEASSDMQQFGNEAAQ